MNDDTHQDKHGPLSESDLRNAFELVVFDEQKIVARDTARRARYFRFGVSMVLVGIFTAIIGTYPLPLDAVMRAAFLVFGLICVVVGAIYVDMSNRRPPKERPVQAKAKGHPPRLIQ